jgi:hypothetical protein
LSLPKRHADRLGDSSARSPQWLYTSLEQKTVKGRESAPETTVKVTGGVLKIASTIIPQLVAEALHQTDNDLE